MNSPSTDLGARPGPVRNRARVPHRKTWLRRVRARLHRAEPLPPVQPLHISLPPRHLDVEPAPHPHAPATHPVLHVPAEAMAEGITAGLESLRGPRRRRRDAADGE